MQKSPKNFGLIIPKIETREEGVEHLLGSIKRFRGLVVNPTGDWISFRPTEESQQRRNVDVFSCATFGTLNAIETLEYKLTGIRKNYSDRAIAILSGTTKAGNDPHKVAETIRKYGLVDEDIFPWDESIQTWEEYMTISDTKRNEIIREGKKWLAKWDFGHEWLWNQNDSLVIKRANLAEANTKGTTSVSVFGWLREGENGLYYKPGGAIDNHWTMNLSVKPNVFDSYFPFVKELHPDYNFLIGKVFYLTPAQPQLSILQKIVNILRQIIGLQKIQVEQVIAINEQDHPIDEDPIIPIDEVLPPPAPPKYDWSTPEAARHSVRVICDEEGLSVDMKNKLTETVKCESAFNPKATNKNNDGSADFGIAQFNDRYWIGAGKPIPSVEVALNNPEFCIRLMARQFKLGNAKFWVCFKRLYPNG